MKKLLLLGAIATGLTFFGSTNTAEAGHGPYVHHGPRGIHGPHGFYGRRPAFRYPVYGVRRFGPAYGRYPFAYRSFGYPGYCGPRSGIYVRGNGFAFGLTR